MPWSGIRCTPETARRQTLPAICRPCRQNRLHYFLCNNFHVDHLGTCGRCWNRQGRVFRPHSSGPHRRFLPEWWNCTCWYRSYSGFIIAAVRHKGFLGGGGIRCVIILPCGAAQTAHNKERCPHGDEHRCKAQHQHQIHFSFTSIPARVVCFAMIFPFRSWQGCLVSIRGVMPLYFLTSIHRFYFTPFCASAPVVSVFHILHKMAPAICGRCHSGNIFYRLFSMAALILVYRLRAAGLLCAERAPAPGTAPQRTRWTAES